MVAVPLPADGRLANAARVSQSSNYTPAMIQWEYTFVTLAAPPDNPYMARDAPIQLYERLAQQLAHLGAHGWEAVGQVTFEVRGAKNDYPQILMKRPVAQP